MTQSPNRPLQPSHSAVTPRAAARVAPVGGRLNGGVRLTRRLHFTVAMVVLLMSSMILCAPLNGAGRPDVQPKVVFLPDDDQEACPGAGQVGCLSCALADYVRGTSPGIYVRFDIKKVMAANLGPFFIYHERYCRPIGKVLGANLFVMTRLVLETPGGAPPCSGRLVRAEMKAWSSVTGKERVIWHSNGLNVDDFSSAFSGHERELLDSILEVAR